MKTIKEVLLTYQQTLQQLYDKREIGAITALVLEELTGFSRAKIKAFPEHEVPAGNGEKLSAVLEELKTGKPVQYILGNASFYGLNFLVNPATLIPRPETEELVEWVVEESGKFKSEKFKVLDIGTGSGCIAVSLKKNLTAANVTALDLSADALKTARQNAVVNEVDVNFIEDSILDIQSGLKDSSFAIIVSNPPYVTLEDKLQMHQNVTDFEPHSALFVPQGDPLIFYKAIANFAAKALENDGLLFLEINENFGKEMVDLLKQHHFVDIELRKDMSGRDRMIKATKGLC